MVLKICADCKHKRELTRCTCPTFTEEDPAFIKVDYVTGDKSIANRYGHCIMDSHLGYKYVDARVINIDGGCFYFERKIPFSEKARKWLKLLFWPQRF